MDFAVAFVSIFVGLSLPLAGLGPWFVRVHAALGNWLLPASLASGVQLSFPVSEELARTQPWALTLLVTPATSQAPITIPMDLRTLVYLPMGCFVALALATPASSWSRNLRLLALGLALLEPLLLALLALPVLSFLGGTGPVHVFALGLGTHTALQVLYRSLVASPGMTYVIPLLLWGALCATVPIPKTERTLRNSKSAVRAS